MNPIIPHAREIDSPVIPEFDPEDPFWWELGCIDYAIHAAMVANQFTRTQAIEHLIEHLEDELRIATHFRHIPYAEYLKSTHWHETRTAAVERANGRCELCASTKSLNVHHKTYDNLWDEPPGDLIVLCRHCHSKFHDKLPRGH